MLIRMALAKDLQRNVEVIVDSTDAKKNKMDGNITGGTSTLSFSFTAIVRMYSSLTFNDDVTKVNTIKPLSDKMQE